MKYLSEPTLKNLSSKSFGVPPNQQNDLLQRLGAPHVDSFNFISENGLALALSDLEPVAFDMPSGDRIVVRFTDIQLNKPIVPYGTAGVRKQTIVPSECRQRQGTYKGRLLANIAWSCNGCEQTPFENDFGEIPIMLKSNRCHLEGMTPKQLVENGEHEQEWGGYFVIKGLERFVRMLLMTRRNYPISISRSGWKSRGPLFSDLGVVMRCVKDDGTASNNVLHYVTNGTVKFMFSHRKILYYAHLGLILKCLCDFSDHYIYEQLISGFEHDLHYSSCVFNMLGLTHEQNLHTQDECRMYLGKLFRVKFFECPSWWTDIEFCDYIIKKCIMIHLDSNVDKFNMIVFMTQKLFRCALGGVKPEGVDSVMMQELLLGGHLYLQILKERLQTWLHILKSNLIKRKAAVIGELRLAAKMSGMLEKVMEAWLATGNLNSPSGLGLMQNSGLSIMPENINRMRYMSHFKAVHRGSFFQEMRTTEVRQLLPDAWGFICPVHTPDGAPCGLLNHLTLNCVVTKHTDPGKLSQIPEILMNLGMLSMNESGTSNDTKIYLGVILDGRQIGRIPVAKAYKAVGKLRAMKVEEILPKHIEIVHIDHANTKQYPGLFLFTGPARMMRPVINLRANKIEYIGTFEQVYMNICVAPEERQSCTTHMELDKTSFMSNLANLIPMPDCNQSPRNMYQCQMGKQTMGTPVHNWRQQAETKLYRLQTPTSPLFRPVHHDNIGLDDFGMGTNAIVAVISYTGYDMEDAMIINKSSYERGFAHGCIYKSEFIELESSASYFARDPQRPNLAEFLDADGLPYIGRILQADEPLYCFLNADNVYQVHNVQNREGTYIDSVRQCGNFGKKNRLACITLRVTRNPAVGDKFASRAGQKGICSQQWQSVDLPFTETGLVPDIVFNPHGFPSRMTIAMMIEIMAGKSGALHGLVHDATPFKFSEEDTAIDYFGRLLEAAGYDYYGTEAMFSGIDGRMMKSRIFFGIVHYQRLRHMVSDKFQVRSTGPIDVLTQQPLKGRKRGGGVRFGEMERDSLISHGSSFLLQDRLLHCTDKTTCPMCTKCKSIIGLSNNTCRMCNDGNHIAVIQIPYIYKYLATQFGAMNISLKLHDELI